MIAVFTLLIGALVSSGLVIQLLVRRLQRRNRELRAAEQELERQRLTLRQKLRTSLTAAAVAHEINQPLSSLSLVSERLIDQAQATPGLADALPLLQVLLSECQRVVELIEKMRMLLHSVETEQGPVSLINATKAALTYLRRLLNTEEVQLQTTGLEGAGAVIHGDGAQLQVAITNLLRNALAAMQETPLQQRRLSVSLRELPGWVELVMADSGPGFPPEWLGLDFSEERLFQSSRTTGMGLGLYLVAATVENHRGRVRLSHSSQLGGAEVTLRFPRLEYPGNNRPGTGST
ncbi:MAG: HAMP domain-containing sensor histidine kinase [Synechococcaceae cyanobacterium ELA739]